MLLRELQDFRVRFTESGNAIFNAREGAHDDLVRARPSGLWTQSRGAGASAGRVVGFITPVASRETRGCFHDS